jgi:hypothetical protein
MEFLCNHIDPHREFLCRFLYLTGIELIARVMLMPEPEADPGERGPSPWPFPVGSWVLPAFWLVILLLAALLRWSGG